MESRKKGNREKRNRGCLDKFVILSHYADRNTLASTCLTMPLPTFTAQPAQANLYSPARAVQRLQHSPRRPNFTAQPAQANLYSTARAGGTAELITSGVVYVVHALQSSIPSSGGGSFTFRTRLGFRVTGPKPNPNPPKSFVKVGRGVTLLASLSRASKERSGLHGAAYADFTCGVECPRWGRSGHHSDEPG